MPKKKTYYTPRKLMELSIKEMLKSKSEHITKKDPKVGAVLANVKGELLDKAFRGEIRVGDHAEFTLIERKNVNKDLSGLVVYTTLEPCVDRNPPKDGCGFRIITARIAKVYIGHPDPDPTVAGNGAEILKQNGIDVEYYDNDLEEIIFNENKEYFAEAVKRSKELSQHELSPSISPLEEELTEYDFTDLSDKAQLDFISRAKLIFRIGTEDFNKFLIQRRLVRVSERGGHKIYRPTGLGLLLLGNNPENHFENAIVKFTTYTDNSNPLIKDFKGALILQPSDIEQYLEVVFPQAIDRTKFKRENIADIPIQVFREVIINAIVHRDYSILTHQIKVYIYPDKVEVHSPGIPLFPIDRFKDFNVPAVSRNSKIAAMFNEMGFMEGRGFGMKEFKTLRSTYGIPEPEFRIDNDFFIVTIYRQKIEVLLKEAFEKLSAKELIGYNLISNKVLISVSEYSKSLGISTRQASRHLQKMLELNLIDIQGKGRSVKYKVK
jgi:ATP-dependent DNA helicase RecG